MKKNGMRIKRIISITMLAVIAVTAVIFGGCADRLGNDASGENRGYTVNFMKNAGKAAVTLSSGYSAIGNDDLFCAMVAGPDGIAELPEGVPAREGFEFDGWYTDRECMTPWNSDAAIESDMSVYAGWRRSESATAPDYVEPVFDRAPGRCTEEEVIKLRRVCSCAAENGEAQLTAASLSLLASHADDVSAFIEYDIAEKAHIVSAVFDGEEITVTASGEAGERTVTVKTVNVTGRYVVDNRTYESKAQKYETRTSVVPGSVLLAGSSSMENWSTSDSDMMPLTSFNVGIGGTTAEQWRDCLAERLVFPYSPRAVVFYVGINNVINAGCSGEETGQAVTELLAKVHERLPETDVYYVRMNLIPGYMKYKTAIEKGNAVVESYAADKDWLVLIDAGSLLLKENGIPNSAYFLTDGLHMSLCGYTIWGREVREAVIRNEIGESIK